MTTTLASELALTNAFGTGAVEVDFDMSVLIQAGLFLVLLLVLKPLLFDPMLKLFEERERRIDGAKLAARKIDEKSSNAKEEYERAMADARAAANAQSDALRQEAHQTESQILETARAQAALSLEQARASTEEQARDLRNALKTEAQRIGADLARKALGREVAG